jgi:hypothetical protein
MKPRAHCWHFTGQSETDTLEGRTGTAVILCCQCGAKRNMRFQINRVAEKGHGRHWLVDETVLVGDEFHDCYPWGGA